MGIDDALWAILEAKRNASSLKGLEISSFATTESDEAKKRIVGLDVVIKDQNTRLNEMDETIRRLVDEQVEYVMKILGLEAGLKGTDSHVDKLVSKNKWICRKNDELQSANRAYGDENYMIKQSNKYLCRELEYHKHSSEFQRDEIC